MRARDDKTARQQARALIDHLGTYVEGAALGMHSGIQMLQDSIGAECGAAWGYTLGQDRVVIDSFHSSGFSQAGGTLSTLLGSALSASPKRWGFFDPVAPEQTQRNVVIPLKVGAERAPIYQTLYAPLGLIGAHHLRVLICDGPRMISWLGFLRAEAFTRTEERALQSLVPATRRRLLLEELLGVAATARRALSMALENVPRPAFVVGRGAAILHANSVGEAILERDRAGVRGALRRRLAGDRTAHFTRFELRGAGLPAYSLLVANRRPSGPTNLAARIVTSRPDL